MCLAMKKKGKKKKHKENIHSVMGWDKIERQGPDTWCISNVQERPCVKADAQTEEPQAKS